jgi:cation:H+ antiporter
LLLLVGGAEGLVRGASALSTRLGISPLAVGLTVVTYGTSAPELAVSLEAAFRETPGLVVGNVVGSNVANLGLVLGAAALIRPLSAHVRLLRQEVPFLLLSAVALPVAALGGGFGRPEGALLLVGALAFTGWCFRRAANEPPIPDDAAPSGAVASSTAIVAYLVIGCVALALGSSLFVEGALSIAETFGISDHVIGLTLVAIGTSLPELATCLVSAARRQVDLVVGNVIGSNVFNVFFILGGTAAVHPIPAPENLLGVDIVVMLALSFALVPFILTGARISRVEGAIYLAAYAGFTYFVLFLR